MSTTMRPLSLLRLFISFRKRAKLAVPICAVAAALVVGCSVPVAPGDAAATPPTTTRSALVCAGTKASDALVAACPAPAGVRPGRACDTMATCPSPNRLFGDCRCDGAVWTCDEAHPPAGYDRYPDCADEGVEAGHACYLEESTCLPATASACFTSGVPLCRCEGHTWRC